MERKKCISLEIEDQELSIKNAQEIVLTTHIIGNQKCTITGRERLIRSHSSARFCFELSGNLNLTVTCYSNFHQNFELEITLD